MCNTYDTKQYENSQKSGLHNAKLENCQLYIDFMVYRKNIRDNRDIVYTVNRIVNTACYKVGRSVTKFSTL